MADNSNPLRLFWPEIDDALSAKAASRLGIWGAGLYCVGTAAITTYATAHSNAAISHLGTLAYAEASVFGLLALGIWRMWRTAAIASLVLFLSDQIIADVRTGVINGYFVAGVLTLFFISGVRGTIMFRKLSRLPPAVDLRDIQQSMR